MPATAKPRRRWFRFSLRTLFVLLTLFCVWLGVQVKWIQDRHKALDWVEAHPVSGVYSYPLAPFPGFPVPLRIFGQKPVEQIEIGVEKDEPQDNLDYIERIKRLF